MRDYSNIFTLSGKEDFNSTALEIFRFQYYHNHVYRQFCDLLGKDPQQVETTADIPYLPIELFKTHKIISTEKPGGITFSSSGTTGTRTSKHHVAEIELYRESFRKGFELMYGNIEDYAVLALLPSYLEREGSSLIFMVDDLITRSKNEHSGFYLHNLRELKDKLVQLDGSGQKVLLIGVSFALLDMAEQFQLKLKNTIVMETGGMKGRRKEMIRSELHALLKRGLGVEKIHSEYGMTELLSQAYSKGDGVFECPPWMHVLIRDPEDALTLLPPGKTGGINVIDLANIYSCSFIATQDLGKINRDEKPEILGRFDNSDIRGCNLLVL